MKTKVGDKFEGQNVSMLRLAFKFMKCLSEFKISFEWIKQEAMRGGGNNIFLIRRSIGNHMFWRSLKIDCSYNNAAKFQL